MDKFTKIKKKRNKKKDKSLIFQKDYLKVYDKEGWLYTEENDSICVIPLFIEDNKIYLRMEVIPPYKSVDKKDYHLTCISGTIEEDESPKECLRRELEEESGISLRDNVNIEFFDTLFKNKGSSSKVHLSILPLHNHQYDETIAKGDGSIFEKKSKTVSVNIVNIKDLNPSDVITKLLLNECQKYLNI